MAFTSFDPTLLVSTTTTTTTRSDKNILHQRERQQNKRILECLGWFLFGVVLHGMLHQRTLVRETRIIRNDFGANETKSKTTTTTTTSNFSSSSSSSAAATFLSDDSNSSSSNSSLLLSRRRSPLKAVFFIGIEGTGHHLLKTVFRNSPTMDHLVHQVKLEGLVRFRQQLFRHKLIISDPPPPPPPPNNNNSNNTRNETKKGVTQHDKGDGLWDASCGGLDHDTERLQMGLRNYLSGWNQKLLDWNNNHTTTARTSSSTTRTTVFPVNTWDEGGGFGMVSYPNFLGDCRFLAYPNLDLWYDGVCGGGENIDCEYVYLYRDPTAILQSTTINRDFNPNVLSGIHLYIAMYHIIASQLLQELLTAEEEEEEEEDSNSSSRRSRSRTLGCYGFYEPNDTSSWWDGVRMLGGWGEPKTGGGSHKNDNNNAPLVLKNHNNVPFEDYDTFMTKMYKAPKPVNDSFIPAEYEMYMKPLKRIHDRVIQICKKNLAARDAGKS